ncbi:MAG: SDR family oxidoreductase [Lachnospiraceae bacterium]|nr:SDR family oxidoreductase [Lachnospiraceae bacterium]
MQTLTGRTCVFSGASGGDGVAAAKALCQAGMNVVVMTHQMAQAASLVEEIQKLGYPGRCMAMQDGEAQTPPVPDEDVYRQIYETLGSIDVVISNTGGDGFEDSIDTVDTDTLQKEVGHLLGGSYSMLKCALPYLRKSGSPRVIFMTSVEGARGGKLESFTNAVAKGAVLSLAKNSAARLASEGITVNCIQKGAITRINGAIVDPRWKDTTTMLPYIPMNRMGTPEDLAAAICFLASEESAYVTGTVLDVSGGLSLV